MWNFIKRAYFPIGVIIGFTAIFFNQLLLHPTHMLYPASDTRIYSAWKLFLKESLVAYGELPLWNPYLFGGTPFIEDTQAAVFYPTTLFFLLFPVDYVFGWLFFLDFILIGIFTYMYTRVISLEKSSALFSALVFMFSGPVTARVFPGHILILDGILYLPLLLYLWEKFNTTKRFIYFPFTALTISLIFFSGNAQMAIFNISVWITYIFIRGLFTQETTSKVSSYRYIICTLLLAILIYSIQLLPSIEFSRLSTRANGLSYEFASAFSLPTKQLISALFPHFFGSPVLMNYWGKGNFWELCMYIGIVPLILSLIAIFKRRNNITVFYTLLSIFSILFALGSYGFVFEFFYNYIPTFSYFRIPARILYVYAFSIAILSGFGFSEFVKITKIGNKTILLLIILSGLLSILVLILLHPTGTNLIMEYILLKKYVGNFEPSILITLIKNDVLLTYAIIISFIFVFIGKVKNLLNMQHVIYSIFILTLLPLFNMGMSLYTTKDTQSVYSKTAIVEFLEKQPGLYRIFDLEGQTIDLASRYKIETLMGYNPTYLKDYQLFLWKAGKHKANPHESFFEFDSVDRLDILRLLNARYIISHKPLAHNELTLILQKGTQYLYEIQHTYPRAYFINSVEKTYNPTSSSRIDIVYYSPNRIELELSTDTNGRLILSENYYPGWKVFVDNQPKKIIPTHSILRAVNVTKGIHRIIFIYQPNTFWIGLILSTIGIFAIIYLIKKYSTHIVK